MKIPARGGHCLVLTKVDADLTLRRRVQRAVEEQGRQQLTNIKVVAIGCMEGCLAGPALLVTPDNVWYGGVTEADVPELVEQHLVGGEPVEMLRDRPEDFCA